MRLTLFKNRLTRVAVVAVWAASAGCQRLRISTSRGGALSQGTS